MLKLFYYIFEININILYIYNILTIIYLYMNPVGFIIILYIN